MAASTFMVDTSPLTVPPGCGCCAAAICTVCSSAATAGGIVGPSWTATVTGYTDQFLARLTTKEQAVIDLTGGTPVHNNINSVPFTLSYGAIPTLRAAGLGYRVKGWLATDPVSSPDELAISQYWDEMSATVGTGGPCSLGLWADYSSNGYNFGGTIEERADISIYCPENAVYDTSGSKLPVQITYNAKISFSRFLSSTTDRISVFRDLLIGTYLEIPLSTISCPVNFSVSLNTNSLCTNCQKDRRAVVNSYTSFLGPVVTTCYDTGASANIPFGGSLLLVE